MHDGFRHKPWRNQAWLAATIGVSEKHISQMLNGHVMGSLEVWDRMLVALEVRLVDQDGVSVVTTDDRL